MAVFGCEEADGEGVGGGEAGAVEADADSALFFFFCDVRCGKGWVGSWVEVRFGMVDGVFHYLRGLMK